MKKQKNSYRKGKRFELLIAKKLREATGIKWARVPLSGGWRYKKKELGLGDLMVHPSDKENVWLNNWIYIECKDRKSFTHKDIVRFLIDYHSSNKLLFLWDDVLFKAKEQSKEPFLFLKVEREIYVIFIYDEYIDFDGDESYIYRVATLEQGIQYLGRFIENLKKLKEKRQIESTLAKQKEVS